MNKDHRTDLAHILQHYNKLSYAQVADPPLMVNIDLQSITVTVGKDAHVVEFKPPLANWDERRTRLIEMTMAAREALGVVTEGDGDHGGHGGAVVVKEYQRPVGKDWIAFVGVCSYYASYGATKAGLVEEGSKVWDLLEWGFPGGAGGFKWLVEAIMLLVLGIHFVEMWWFDRTRSSKFGVKRGSGVWLLWMGSVFLEGVGAFWRFDRVVRKLRKEAKRG